MDLLLVVFLVLECYIVSVSGALVVVVVVAVALAVVVVTTHLTRHAQNTSIAIPSAI